LQRHVAEMMQNLGMGMLRRFSFDRRRASPLMMTRARRSGWATKEDAPIVAGQPARNTRATFARNRVIGII
jgi:hypothetical protein